VARLIRTSKLKYVKNVLFYLGKDKLTGFYRTKVQNSLTLKIKIMNNFTTGNIFIFLIASLRTCFVVSDHFINTFERKLFFN